MTIICPSCDARFRNPPTEVLTSRPLQCSKCEHQWYHERMKMAAPSLSPDMRDLVGNPQKADPTGIHVNLPVVMPGQPTKSTSETHNENTRPPIYVDREPAVVPKKSLKPVWSSAGVACLAALAATIYFKDAVILKAPQLAPVFRAAGLTPQNPDLAIANVVTTRSTRDGIRQLIVRGDIENVANNTVPVPPIKLIMRGKTDSNLYAWTVSSTKTSLSAGEKGRFTAVAHDFPDEAVNVEVEFAPDNSKDTVKPTDSE